MAHFRARHVLLAFNKLCSFSPLVGIFGHRQVGKTTFLERYCRSYNSFDDFKILHTATLDPALFLNEMKGSLNAIDEAQLVPALFPALKLKVQRNKKPGQFVLSGSVRFTSRKAIRESLTGRIATVELLPLTLSELRSDALPDFVPRQMDQAKFSLSSIPRAEHNRRFSDYKKYFECGGLPGVCFIREVKNRERTLQDIIRTILDRDLRLVYQTPLSLSELLHFCKAISKLGTKPFRIQPLTRTTGISAKTINSLVDALEAIYLVRKIPIEGHASRSYLILFEDQFEQQFLSEKSLDLGDQRFGLFYRNIRAQFEYQLGITPTFFSFKTRGGSEIPLCVRSSEGIMGFIALSSSSGINRSLMASITSFYRAYANSKVIIAVEDELESHLIDSRTMIVPVTHLF